MYKWEKVSQKILFKVIEFIRISTAKVKQILSHTHTYNGFLFSVQLGVSLYTHVEIVSKRVRTYHILTNCVFKFFPCLFFFLFLRCFPCLFLQKVCSSFPIDFQMFFLWHVSFSTIVGRFYFRNTFRKYLR